MMAAFQTFPLFSTDASRAMCKYYKMGVVNSSSLMGLGRNAKFFGLDLCGMEFVVIMMFTLVKFRQQLTMDLSITTLDVHLIIR